MCGTLPDLDVLIDHGDPLRNMTLHRTESHSLFWLALVTPLVAWLVTRIHADERERYARWCIAVGLALLTHPLLDAMTVYGTQFGLPFTDHPFAVGSVFIIDPLYTVPLLAGVGLALRHRDRRGLRANAWGLALSTAYLAWGAAAQAHVRDLAVASARANGIAFDRVLVTPTPFNTVLWRIVLLDGERYHEGFRSLLDGDAPLRFDAFPRNGALDAVGREIWSTARMAWFTQGLYKVDRDAEGLIVTDLRMGFEPHYTFAFRVAAPDERGRWAPVLPQSVGTRGDVAAVLAWTWRRLSDSELTPPRTPDRRAR